MTVDVSSEMTNAAIVSTAGGGFPIKVFKDEIVDKKYLCSECRLIIHNPVQSSCGHRFCKECIDNCLRRQEESLRVCRVCVEEQEADVDENSDEEDVKTAVIDSDKVFADNAIRRELNRLEVVCCYDGCVWTNKYLNLESHKKWRWVLTEFRSYNDNNAEAMEAEISGMGPSHLATCDWRPVTCSVCHQSVAHKDLRDHEKSHRNPDGIWTCQFCNEQIARDTTEAEHLKIGTTHHLTILHERIQQLESLIGIEQLAAMATTTTTTTATVLAAATTATTTATSATILAASPDSLSENSLTHRIQTIDISMKKLQKTINDLETKIGSDLSSGLGGTAAEGAAIGGAASAESGRAPSSGPRLTGSGTSGRAGVPVAQLGGEGLPKKLADIDSQLTIFEGVITVLNREVEKLSDVTDRTTGDHRSHRQTIDSLVQKASSLERQLEMKDALISGLEGRVRSLEETSYDGVLLWKLGDFSKLREEARLGRTPSFYSPPFYTSKTGYKVCARIYLNGEGAGRGTHVSLFFVVMKGNYDAMLRWPFKHRVTLMFLDQANRENVTDSFRPDPTSSSFRRPTTDMNVASGCPQFLPLAELDNPNKAYVRDNAAFLKVIVTEEEGTST